MKGGISSLKKNAVILSAVIFCLLISAGCATKEALKNVSDEDVLRERAMAYWKYRINGELDKSYIYEDPLTRKKLSVVSYIQRYSNPMVGFSSYEIVAISRKGKDVFAVTVKLRVLLKAPGAKLFEHDTQITEQWIRDDESWYHAPGSDNTFTR